MEPNNTQRTDFCNHINTPRQFRLFSVFRSVLPMTNWRDRFKTRFTEMKRTKGVTQESLAEQMGLTQGTVGHWLNGRRSPDTLSDYEKLAVALEMHPAELLYGINPEQTIGKEGAEFARAWEGLPSKERSSVKTLVLAFKKQKSTKRGGER